ncbi:MAG: triose-phosphate isomerase [Candidatus Gribaldobacteria bacterium]|nr:triose-phosphate isomerase [Candidatus Gribaldobacteria bacterium]
MLYGGSVDSANSDEYLKTEIFNGLLIGGASLKIKEFLKIVLIV